MMVVEVLVVVDEAFARVLFLLGLEGERALVKKAIAEREWKSNESLGSLDHMRREASWRP